MANGEVKRFSNRESSVKGTEKDVAKEARKKERLARSKMSSQQKQDERGSKRLEKGKARDRKKLTKINEAKQPDTKEIQKSASPSVKKIDNTPEASLIPLSFKENFTPEIQGGNVDENGETLSPKHSLIKIAKAKYEAGDKS